MHDHTFRGTIMGLYYGSLPGLLLSLLLSEPEVRLTPIIVMIGCIVGMIIGFRKARPSNA